MRLVKALCIHSDSSWREFQVKHFLGLHFLEHMLANHDKASQWLCNKLLSGIWLLLQSYDWDSEL